MWSIRRRSFVDAAEFDGRELWEIKEPILVSHYQLSSRPLELTGTFRPVGANPCIYERRGLIVGTDEQSLTHRLRVHVEQLASEIGERNIFHPAALQAAASYIERQWEKQGYAVTRLAYDISGVHCPNLEITRSGGVREREILLIGAHYDTVIGSPGANDNASGVSALLEISRLFASVEPALTVRFVAFVNEEPPFFMTSQQGSMVYAETARKRGDDIRLMTSIETIGWYSSEPGSQSYPPLFNLLYPDRADFIGIVSNFRSRAVMRRLAAAFRANSDFPLETAATFSFVPGVSWSDHRSFWTQGYPAVMITDTAFYRYRHYHAASDTPEKLAYPELARVTLGLFASFSDLASGRVG
jgi:Peptidase family M28